MTARRAQQHRQTRETDIAVSLNLDGTGRCQISTGMPFLDHMLELFGRHALVDLKIKARGDLPVDYHHTVEDLGLVLGTCLDQALGQRKGIRRYGWCHTINVGHWCVSGNQFRPLYQAWKEVLESRPYGVDGADQAAFNAVVRRGLVPAKPIDRGLICTALAVPESEWMQHAIIHFAGWLDHRLQKMQELARAPR